MKRDLGIQFFFSKSGLMVSESIREGKPHRQIKLSRMATGLSVLVTCVAWACSDARSPSSYSVRDSSGVRVVETGSSGLEESPVFTLSNDPILHLGTRDAGGASQFFRVTGGAFLSDGRIVVLNNGTRTIRVFNAGGQALIEFGRDGEGPGEFRSLSSIQVLPGDTLFVWDRRRRAFSLFTPSGELIRSHRIIWTGGQQLIELRSLQDGRLVGKTYAGPDDRVLGAGPGIHRTMAPIPIFDRDGTILGTLGDFPNAEFCISALDGGPAYSGAPFGKDLLMDVVGTRIVIGTADQMEVGFWDPTLGLAELHRVSGVDLTVRQEDRDWYRDHYFDDAETSEELAERSSFLERRTYPETRAAYSSLSVDPERRVWLRTGRHLPFYSPSREWTALSSEGQVLGSLSMPEGFTVLAFGSDKVLGVWRDELDVEFLRVYSLGDLRE